MVDACSRYDNDQTFYLNGEARPDDPFGEDHSDEYPERARNEDRKFHGCQECDRPINQETRNTGLTTPERELTINECHECAHSTGSNKETRNTGLTTPERE